MNILFVHEVDWLTKVVFEIHNLSEMLSARGHNVYAVDYPDTWFRNGLFDFGTLKTQRFEGVSRAVEGGKIGLLRPGLIKLPLVSRPSALITHYSEIKKTILERDIEVIILYSAPTNGPQTVRLGRKFNIPVIFRSIDILSRLVRYPALRPLTRRIERRVYSGADMVLALTPDLARYVADLGAAPKKIRLLPPAVDTSIFRPGVDTSEVRRKWNLDEQERIVLFMGTFFEFSGLDCFVTRFPEVLSRIPDARLLLVGDGPQRPVLEKLIDRLNLGGKVTITGFQPYQSMPEYIGTAEICINPFLYTDVTRDIIPTKALQYLACGKPVLATPLPGMVALIPGEREGVVYAASPDETIDQTIALLESDGWRNVLGSNALNYASLNSYHQMVDNLESILFEAVESVGKR
ncbi:MAG: glycosyltransferase [Dehalococcoidia bacterium]